MLTGGQAGCERQAAFFLPEHMAAEDFDPAEHIRAVKLQAHFGAPGHRDYLGAALGLGITRESLGDIRIFDDVAYLFCLPTVEPLLLEELKKVGRISVTASPCPLEEVPAPLVRVKALSFTVKSLRLDAILGGMFGLSRTAAAEQIRMGLASLNYAPCERTDAAVKEGDVISVPGTGKAVYDGIAYETRKKRF